MSDSDIHPEVPPGGTGCEECLREGGWWVHLRRCGVCGHIGCCDSSPRQHAARHFHATGHAVTRSFEPGEGWFHDYRSRRMFEGPELHPPASHLTDQPAPGPAGSVPDNWQDLVHRQPRRR